MTALNKSDRSGVNPRVAAPDVHTVMPGVQSEVNRAIDGKLLTFDGWLSATWQ